MGYPQWRWFLVFYHFAAVVANPPQCADEIVYADSKHVRHTRATQVGGKPQRDASAGAETKLSPVGLRSVFGV